MFNYFVACIQYVLRNYKGEDRQVYNCHPDNIFLKNPLRLEMNGCVDFKGNDLPTGKMCLCDTDYCLVDGGIGFETSSANTNLIANDNLFLSLGLVLTISANYYNF